MTEITREYIDNYTKMAHDDLVKDMIPLWYRKAQANKMRHYCRYTVNKAILDIGVGRGETLELIKARHKVGIDISMEYLKTTRAKGIITIESCAEFLPFKSQSFDIIIMSDILEHVFSPLAVLSETRRVLKPNGKLLIRVPYKEDLSSYTSCGYKYTHLRTYDEDTLSSTLNQAGLKVTKFHYDGFLAYRTKSMPNWMRLVLHTIERANYKIETLSRASSKQDKTEATSSFESIPFLPSWLARIFFTPIEIVAEAKP